MRCDPNLLILMMIKMRICIVIFWNVLDRGMHSLLMALSLKVFFPMQLLSQSSSNVVVMLFNFCAEEIYYSILFSVHPT